jgi:Undecaprenyl-phosphate glucose phosphotransferase
MIKKHQRFFNVLLLTLDALTLAISYYCAYLVRGGLHHLLQGEPVPVIAPLWMVPLLLVVYYFSGVYAPMRREVLRKEALLLVRAHFIGMVLIYSILFLEAVSDYPRGTLPMFGVVGTLCMLAERFAVRKTLKHFRSIGYNLKHLLVVGAGDIGKQFAAKVQNHRNFGYNVVGFLDDSPKMSGATVAGKRVLGTCRALPGLLAGGGIDEVVVALPMRAYRRYGWIVRVCEKEGVRLSFIPDHYDFLPGTMRIEDFDGIPLMNIRTMPLDDPLNRLLKRLLDLFVATVAILTTGPLMLVIACTIKVTSAGPVLFRQRRVGLGNREFEILKFRTMQDAGDDSSDQLWTTAVDPRKTGFGAFLRRFSLDELPQFFNVLQGEMSVVGPRPERPFFVEQFKEDIPRYMIKHLVKPGITGWAQVNGWRGDTSIEKRIECDLYYIEHWDILLDTKIMLMTVFRGLFNRNAY